MVYAEKKCLTILCKSTHVIDEYPSEERLEFLRTTEQPTWFSKIQLISLQLSEGEYTTSCSSAGSLHCTVGRDFCHSSSITNNHSDDS